MSIQEHFAKAAQNNGDRLSPLPGVDMLTYRNFVMRALNGDEMVPSTMLFGQMATRSAKAPEQQERDRKAFQYLLWKQALDRQLEEIDRLIARYQEIADWHTAQASLARIRMNEAADKLEEIDTFVSGAINLLEEKQRTGKLDREAALELLRTRGIVLGSGIDDAELQVALVTESNNAAAEKSQWVRQYEDAEVETKRHETLERENRRKAEELIERRDAIRSGGYDPDDEVLLLQKVTEEYKMDIQIRADDIEQERQRLHQEQEGTKPVAAFDVKALAQSQTQNEEADFLASLGNLKATFTAAATGASIEEPDPNLPKPVGPVPGAPGIKV